MSARDHLVGALRRKPIQGLVQIHQQAMQAIVPAAVSRW